MQAIPGDPCTKAQHDAAREIIFSINQRDFPVPTITTGVKTAGIFRNMVLIWDAQDREWTISIDSDGLALERWGPKGNRQAARLPEKGDGLKLRTTLLKRREWLLFGDKEVPGVAEIPSGER
jgi:hypothetical protein